MEYLNNYLALLWRMFEFDISVLSKPWMYYILLLPAIGYMVFFFCQMGRTYSTALVADFSGITVFTQRIYSCYQES